MGKPPRPTLERGCAEGEKAGTSYLELPAQVQVVLHLVCGVNDSGPIGLAVGGTQGFHWLTDASAVAGRLFSRSEWVKGHFPRLPRDCWKCPRGGTVVRFPDVLFLSLTLRKTSTPLVPGVTRQLSIESHPPISGGR